MIISHKYKYVFVELPHTGTTAISRELRANYDGEKILGKHSLYHEFLREATPEQRQYKVFSGMRNPMDEAVSLYFKFRGDHKGKYSDAPQERRPSMTRRSLAMYDFIRENDAEFHQYFKRFYHFPHDNWSRVTHGHCDFVIRFESLQQDFTKMLEMVGAEQVRPLPRINKTSLKDKPYLEYYTPEIRGAAVRIFGPFMKRWGYELPPEWGCPTVPWGSRVLFALLGGIRHVYWRYVRWNDNPVGRLVRRLLRPADGNRETWATESSPKESVEQESVGQEPSPERETADTTH